MTSVTTNSTSSIPYIDRSSEESSLAGSPILDQGPVYYGLSLATWIKIGVLSLLTIAFYRFNLTRLWVKTNPFTGQGNWEHAVIIPIIGLYYLYSRREELLRPRTVSADSRSADEPWTLPAIWAFSHLIPLLLLAVAVPLLMGELVTGVLSFNPQVIQSELARVPLALIMAGLLVCSAAAAGLIFYKSDELRRSAVQQWLNNVWHGLGAWLILTLVTQGVFFFLLLFPHPVVEPIVRVLHIVSLAASVLALGFIAWQGHAQTWRRRYDAFLSRSSSWFGGFVMVWGILFSLWGIWPGQNDFFKDVGMVISIFGLVLLMTNWSVMRIAWFPIVFLFCALPWPDQVYSWVALPLQNLAARVGVVALHIFRVDAGQEGTIIWMKDAQGQIDQLSVEQACAGLKSLMTFVSIAAAIAFLSNRLLWQKLVIVAMAVPIAIMCNTGRIAAQGLLHRYASKEWSKDFAHGFVGLLLLIPGFLLIMGVCWLVDHLFIEEADSKTDTVKRTTGATTATATDGATLPAAAAATPAVALAGAAPAIAAAPTPTPTPPASGRTVIKIPKRPAPTTTPPAATAPAVTAPAAATPAAPPATKPVAPAAAPAAKPAVTTAAKPAVTPAAKPASGAPAAKPAVVPQRTAVKAPTAPAAAPSTASAPPAAAKPAGVVKKPAVAPAGGVAPAAAPTARPAQPRPPVAPSPATPAPSPSSLQENAQ